MRKCVKQLEISPVKLDTLLQRCQSEVLRSNITGRISCEVQDARE